MNWRGGGWTDLSYSENEIVGWHHQLNGHEFEQTPGDGEGQGCLVCCSPQGCKELDRTERLNNNFLPFVGGNLKTWKQGFCINTTIEMTPPRFRRDEIQEARLPLQFPPFIGRLTEATASFFPKGRGLGTADPGVRRLSWASDSWVSGEGAVKFWDPIQSFCDVLRDDIKCFISCWPWYSHTYLWA